MANGVFRDIGFVATGNVNFRYSADVVPGPGVSPITTVVSCPLAIATPVGAGNLVQIGFVAAAQTNLDADALVSTWDSTNDHGATDCTTGIF